MSLDNSPGWDLYRSIIASQIEERKNRVFFNAAESMDHALQQEFMKGEGSGMYQTMTLIQPVIEALQQELESRKFEENEEDA